MKNDLFSLNRSFYISSDNFYKSSCGGILSILFISILIPVLYYISQDFIFGRNPILNKYQVNKLQTSEWEKVDIPIMISFPRYLLNETIIVEWDEETYLYYLSNMTECNNEQYNTFINEPKNESMIYLCQTYNKFTTYYIEVIHCSKYKIDYFDTTNITCGNGNENFTYTNYYIPELVSYIRYKKLNTLNFYNPVEIDDVITYNKSKLYLVMNSNKLINDIGYFFKNEIINYFFSVSHKYEGNVDNYYYLFRIEIRVDWEYEIEKSYMKIQELNARLIAIIKLLFVIFSLINWNEYFYCKYFLSIYLNLFDPHILKSKIQEKLGIKEDNPVLLDRNEIKNEILSMYSFGNYLLSLIPFCSTKGVIRIKVILNEIKHFISMENYLDQYPKINIVELEEKKGFFKGFLTKLDFLAKHKSFYINSNERFLTRLGVFFTYIYILSYIPILYFIGYDFWFKLNPYKNNYNYDNRNLINKPDNYSPNIPMMIEVSKSFANYTELLQYNYNTLGYNKFKYHECSDDEYYSFNKTTPKKNDIKYICTNVGNLIGNYFKDEELDTFISFVNCTSLEKFGIKDYSCSKEPPETDETIFFAISSKVQLYRNTYDNYISNSVEYIEHSRNYNKYERSWYVLKYTEKRIFNDYDIFFSKKSLEIIYEPSTYQLIPKESDILMGNFFDAYIQFWSYHNVVDKIYLKFPDILSRVFSLMDILYGSLFLINFLCETYFFHEIFKDIFFKYLHSDNLENILNQSNKIINKNDKSASNKSGNISSLKNNISIHFNNSGKTSIKSVNKEELIALFTFWNYISYKLFFCCFYKNTKMIKIKALYNEFQKFLYIENTFIFKNKLDNNETIITNSLNRTEKFLKKFDLLTFKGIIHINQNTVFKTTLGGIISLIYLIGLVGFFYYFGYDFFARSNPNIQIYQANYHEIENYTSLWQVDVPIYISYSKDLINKTRYENYNPYNGNWELDYGIHECSDDIKNMDFYNSSLVYNCTNLNQLFGNHFEGLWSTADIYLLGCSDSSDRNCTEDPNPNKTYWMEYYLKTPKLLYDKYDNYITDEIFNFKKENYFKYLIYSAFSFKITVFYDDKGVLFPELKKEVFTSTDYIAKRTPKKYGGLRLRINFNENLVTIVNRTYKKLPQMLSEVMSLTFFFKFILDIVYTLISDYLFEQYFLKLFFERINILSLTNKINRKILKNDGDYIELDYLSEIQISLYIKEYLKLMNFWNFIKFNYLNIVFKDNEDLLRYEVIVSEYKIFLSLDKVILFGKSTIKNSFSIKNYSNLNASENLNLNIGLELKINKQTNLDNNQ